MTVCNGVSIAYAGLSYNYHANVIPVLDSVEIQKVFSFHLNHTVEIGLLSPNICLVVGELYAE